MNDDKLDPQKEINDQIQRSLNESKRDQLASEFGMSHGYVNPEIDPELEGDFLDYITQWERANAVAQQTTVWEFLGKPEIVPAEGLTIEEMERELDRIYAIMDENEMALDCINDIDIRELYEFVSGDFMKTECSDMRIPGMTHRFIYEEFFPEKYPYEED
jgi:hypothetical protein